MSLFGFDSRDLGGPAYCDPEDYKENGGTSEMTEVKESKKSSLKIADRKTADVMADIVDGIYPVIVLIIVLSASGLYILDVIPGIVALVIIFGLPIALFILRFVLHWFLGVRF